MLLACLPSVLLAFLSVGRSNGLCCVVLCCLLAHEYLLYLFWKKKKKFSSGGSIGNSGIDAFEIFLKTNERTGTTVANKLYVYSVNETVHFTINNINIHQAQYSISKVISKTKFSEILYF